MKPTRIPVLLVLVCVVFAAGLALAACGGEKEALTTLSSVPPTVSPPATTAVGVLPAPAVVASMAYESMGGTVVLFGGFGDAGGKLRIFADTWIYDPVAGTWSLAEPGGTVPPARWTPALAYDPAGSRVILFGGCDTADVSLNDTWAYDPAANTWTELKPAGSLPPARWGHALAHDPGSAKVIMFGGCEVLFDPSTFYNDTWAYDPAANTWTELKPAGDVPSPRNGPAMVCDEAGGRLLLYGGQLVGPDRAVQVLTDTWAYDPGANAWSER
jgi:N-acetylneuraminic acid mutarotase